MSYQVLARKWRPKTFAELVGQDHVKNTLMNGLSMGRLHHAYLFTGTRGVGKTTIARIYAKSLNCENGVTANPCGVCDACVSIEKGHFVDLIEIDAASRTKVEDTREILDNVQYAPARGRFKVYLIDEVHMLSRNSFNALLKTLEEPPEHVKFLLATTDPQKLPITILSRCLQFNLKALTRSEIEQHLTHILTEEQLSFDEGSLALLAKAAEGSLRDALSLTDQAIAQSNGSLLVADVRQMLGTVDNKWCLKLLADIVKQDAEQAMETLEQIALYMPNYRQLIDQLLSIFHLAAMTQWVPNAAKIEEGQQKYIQRLAQKLSPQDLQLYYQILLQGKRDIELAPDGRMGFEMLLLRLLAFQPLAQVARPPEQSSPAPKDIAQTTNIPVIDSGKKNAEIRPKSVKPALEAPKIDVEPVANQAVAESAGQRPTTVITDEKQLAQEQQQIVEMAQSQGFAPESKPESGAKSKPLTEPVPVKPDVVLEKAPEKELKKAPETEPVQIESAPVEITQPQPQDFDVDPFSALRDQQDEENDTGYYDTQAYFAESTSFDVGSHAATENDSEVRVQPQSNETKPSLIQPSSEAGDAEDPLLAILANRNIAVDEFLPNDNDNKEVKAAVAPKLNRELDTEAEAPVELKDEIEVEAQDELKEAVEESAPAPVVTEQVDIEKADIGQADIEQIPQTVEQPQPVPEAEAEAETELKPEPAATPQNNEQLIQQPSEPAPAAQPTDDRPRWAAQIDEWANVIETMGLGGLARIFLVKSVWQREDKNITLTVAESEHHLESQSLRDQIEKALVRTLNSPIELTINYTSEELNTPFNIQRQIEADRLVYAKQCVYQDPLIGALQQQFGAEVYDDSIKAIG